MSQFKGIPIVPRRSAAAQRRQVPHRRRASPRSRMASRPSARRRRRSLSVASRSGCAHPCPRVRHSMRCARTVQGASARHGVRGSQVSEHRRVLECRHGDTDADGRRLHARLPFLLGRYRQSSRLAGSRGAGQQRAHRAADEAEVRRADIRESRRSARWRRGAFRSLRARDQAAQSRHRGRGADAGFPGRCWPTSKPSSAAGSRCSHRTSRPCVA